MYINSVDTKNYNPINSKVFDVLEKSQEQRPLSNNFAGSILIQIFQT